MVAALETLGTLPNFGNKIAVLGKMGELGVHATEGYRRVGEKAARVLNTLICVGKETATMSESAAANGLSDVSLVEDNAAAAQLLSSIAKENDLVLLKASRSARMEEILQQFT
jgi:UDP-N-acetylmuramyl pentapeptide synthase